MKPINAKTAKAALLKYLLYDKKYRCAVTEYAGPGVQGNADVYGFTEAGYTQEFEIKVARSDLLGELNSIQLLVQKGNPESDNLFTDKKGEQDFTFKGCAKLTKHARYLEITPPGDLPWNWGGRELHCPRPSKFSFLVPTELVELSKEKLEGSPYGLYSIRSSEYHYFVSEEIRPKYLVKEKVPEEAKEYMLRKVSTEIQVLRERDAEPKKCTRCKEHLPGRCHKCTAELEKERQFKACLKQKEKEGVDIMDAYKLCREES